MRSVFAVVQPPLWLRLALEAPNDDGLAFGSVVWSGFLWRDEHLAGALTGRKRRPCVVIGCRRRRQRLEIALLPVSHSSAKGRPHIRLRSKLAEPSLLDDRINRLYLTDGNVITVSRDGVNPAAYGGLLTPEGCKVLRRALRHILRTAACGVCSGPHLPAKSSLQHTSQGVADGYESQAANLCRARG